MKIRLFPFIRQFFFLVLLLAFFGCNQDDTPDYNYFKVGDKEYKIEECVITKYYEDDTSGVFNIAFYYDLEFRDIDTSNNVINIPIEENGIFFNDCLFSGSVKQGLYQVIDTTWGWGYNTIKKDIFYRGNIIFNIEEPEMRLYELLTGGELSIKTEGENCIIEFNCAYKEYENKKVIGYFSGTPLEYNFKMKPRS